MRGAIRAFFVAAAALALPASHALADASKSEPVPFRLVTAGPSRTADSYLNGSAFATRLDTPSGPLSFSGTIDPRFGVPATSGPPLPDRFNFSDVAAEVPLSSSLSLDLAYRSNTVGPFNGFDASGYDGLFLSPSANGANHAPFGNANYVGATFKLSNNIALHAGEVSSVQDRNAANENTFSTLSRPVDALIDFGTRTANTLMAGVTFKASDWGGLDLTASHTQEKNLIGATPFSALSTDAVAVSANVKFGDGWVTTATYGQSLTKLDIKPSALAFSSAGELRQTGYALSVAKHGVFGDDALGLSVSRPMDPEAVSGGFVTVASPTNQPVFIGPDHLLADQRPETDIDLGYTTSFNDSFALQTNAAFEMNFQGKNGSNAVQLLSRAKIKF
jgi:hypothetical protein